jgi:hypothetical protein
MRILQHLLLTFWAGGLWAICGIAAPSAFAVLERSAAGALVGRLFSIAAWGGAAIAVFIIATSRQAPLGDRSSRIWIGIAGLTPLLSELLLGPLMRQARLAGDMQRFALMHGMSAVLFLISGLSLLTLVVRVSRAR